MPRGETTLTVTARGLAAAEDLIARLWVYLERHDIPAGQFRVRFGRGEEITITISFEQAVHCAVIRDALLADEVA